MAESHSLIRHISDTARWAAIYRARETERPNAVFRDPLARRKIAHDPYVRVAVIRSGEILGRYHDTHGRTDVAIATYREILRLDHNSLIAGRLLVLLARGGDLRAAAGLAEEAIVSRPNLYPRLPDSVHIASLKEEIARR